MREKSIVLSASPRTVTYNQRGACRRHTILVACDALPHIVPRSFCGNQIRGNAVDSVYIKSDLNDFMIKLTTSPNNLVEF